MNSAKVSVSEAAKIIGITEHAVRNLLITGQLPATRSGRNWIIMRATVDAFKDGSLQRPNAPQVDVADAIKQFRITQLRGDIARMQMELDDLQGKHGVMIFGGRRG